MVLQRRHVPADEIAVGVVEVMQLEVVAQLLAFLQIGDGSTAAAVHRHGAVVLGAVALPQSLALGPAAC